MASHHNAEGSFAFWPTQDLAQEAQYLRAIGYELSPGDMMLVPKDNHIKYEADDRCTIFYAAWPVDWKQKAGLTEVPGIGKKMANRLILELKDKLGVGWASVPAAQIAEENAEVLAALTSLGYSASEATRAVASLPADSKLSLEDKVKQALAYFTTK